MIPITEAPHFNAREQALPRRTNASKPHEGTSISIASQHWPTPRDRRAPKTLRIFSISWALRNGFSPSPNVLELGPHRRSLCLARLSTSQYCGRQQ